MKKIPKKIKDYFYNPESDSISKILSEAGAVHAEIIKMTSLEKGTLKIIDTDDIKAIYDFKIPLTGLSKNKLTTTISGLFQGVARWHSPHTMYNAAPPPLLPTVVTKIITSLYNPNLALHTASGKSLVTEQKVIKSIADYIGWNSEKSGGIFTWGGKATTMYAIKIGLKNCSPNSDVHGVKDDVVVFSTDAGHPSHISDAEWLGIGSANVIRLKTDKNTRVDLREMEKAIREAVNEEKKIATIIVSGGTTNDMAVDPISKIVKLRDRLVAELKLNYVPHIHVDTVVAFPWIFFKDYNFSENSLEVTEGASKRISKIVEDLKHLYKADSFGFDFHKMGFCPYVSSIFMVKNGKTLSSKTENAFNWPFFYSMENSRSADGPNSAYVALNTLGVEGFQILIAHLTETALHLNGLLEQSPDFDVINKIGLGTATLFIPCVPKKVTFENFENEVKVRNEYSMAFINKLTELGNPFYIDKIPSNSTGAAPFPFTSLKTYIMSPYSTKQNNIEFMSFLSQLKREIDQNFNFYPKYSNASEEAHPLRKD